MKTIQVKLTNYLDNLKKLHLTDAIFTQSKQWYGHIGITLLGLLIGFPLYVFGLITNYLPYILPSKIAQLISSDITYRAPIMMTAGVLTFPLCYGLEIWGAHTFFQQHWLTLGFALSLPIGGYFVLGYWDVVARLGHLWQALRLFRQKPTLMQSLSDERAEIFKAFEAAKGLLPKT
ncbi:MAG: hypothetical protein R2822_08765 [Spirosomataceae bacterium]